jgi:hypothetical protein
MAIEKQSQTNKPSEFDKVVKSLKSVSFVIPADPGSWSGAGAGIQ